MTSGLYQVDISTSKRESVFIFYKGNLIFCKPIPTYTEKNPENSWVLKGSCIYKSSHEKSVVVCVCGCVFAQVHTYLLLFSFKL